MRAIYSYCSEPDERQEQADLEETLEDIELQFEEYENKKAYIMEKYSSTHSLINEHYLKAVLELRAEQSGSFAYHILLRICAHLSDLIHQHGDFWREALLGLKAEYDLSDSDTDIGHAENKTTEVVNDIDIKEDEDVEMVDAE